MDLSYTFDNVNAFTALADSDDATYSAVVTCDANGNITGIEERKTVSGSVVAHEYQYYAYDDLNRLSNWRTKTYSTVQRDWKWRKREHLYDGQGRLVHSTRKEWWNNDSEPSGDSLEHIYAGSRHIGNTDGSSNYGTVWNWAGAEQSHQAPLRSPNADTASQKGYNIAASSGPGGEPQRRTFLNPTTEGKKRLLYAQGEPDPAMMPLWARPAETMSQRSAKPLRPWPKRQQGASWVQKYDITQEYEVTQERNHRQGRRRHREGWVKTHPYESL